jgi:acyl-ACP thioesterase
VPRNPDSELPLVPVPDEGYVYQTGWRLATSDIDEHRRLRLDGVARYIQEVGAEHLADAELAEVHPHWIVLRTVIDVIEPIELPSDITFRRWCWRRTH